MSIYVRDIRRAIAARIRALEIPGLLPNRVVTNRTRPYSAEDLPCVCIFTTSETAELADQAPRTFDCTAEIAIACYVATPVHEDSDEDDELDALMQEVRELMNRDPRCDEFAQDSTYTGSDWVLSNQGEYALGCGILRYAVKYREERQPGEAGRLANLERIHVEWDAAPEPDGTIDAQNDVKVN